MIKIEQIEYTGYSYVKTKTAVRNWLKYKAKTNKPLLKVVWDKRTKGPYRFKAYVKR